MRRCAEQGLSTLNLGRTSLSNEGLRRFKLGFGAVEETMRYAKGDFCLGSNLSCKLLTAWMVGFNRVFASMPLPVLRLAGAALYPRLS